MIVSIGEIVWDIFAEKQVLGGAPVNVAYHLRCLGIADIRVITKVGVDALGETTVDQLKSLGLPLEGVQKDSQLPTGRVKVMVDKHNEPHFEIVAPAAWDNIELDKALAVIGDRPFSMVFGTLAQRDERSRQTIQALWEKAEARFYDVNLRPPFTTRELVMTSLKAADLVKMNGEELTTIANWAGIDEMDRKEAARTLLRQYDIKAAAVTEGRGGAWMMAGDEYYSHPGYSVTVADTVGAGDAFFAALIEGYVTGSGWSDSLARANKRGGYVASQKGATPPMPDQI